MGLIHGTIEVTPTQFADTWNWSPISRHWYDDANDINQFHSMLVHAKQV